MKHTPPPITAKAIPLCLGNPAGVPVSSPLAGASAVHSCPQCDSVLEGRIADEDTGCSYPCDGGEGYCAQCDAVWSTDHEPTWEEFVGPFKRLADGFLRVEL